MNTRSAIGQWILGVVSLSFYQDVTAQTCFPQSSTGNVQMGKTFININKPNGGTIEPGDTLEVRATIAVGKFNSYAITRVRYNDTISSPNLTYIPNSLRCLTNEGLLYRQYTDAENDDSAHFFSNRIRFNIGATSGASNDAMGNATTNAGNINGNVQRPSFYNGVCIRMYTYRVRINPATPLGTTIRINAGNFRFRDASAIDYISCFTDIFIRLTPNSGVCTNQLSASLISDNNGTFGSGTTQVKGASSTLVPGYLFSGIYTGMPNDGSYTIVNNSSTTGITNPNVSYPSLGAPLNAADTNRVFGLWNIMGDHTGAVSATAGNPPVARGTNGGYTVLVNASYATSDAIKQTVTQVCPETYYEFSAWFKNICPGCACDSTGDGAYSKTGAGNWIRNPAFNGPDTAGVKPNLAFLINDTVFYTTGNIPYTGQWVKKGFLYKTAPGQTSFKVTIRNNAPGGGGNDWAMDDVSLGLCTPDISFYSFPLYTVCDSNVVDNMSATVTCFFNNYTYYIWERSANGGATWTSTGVSGTATPVLSGGQYTYTVTYPSFIAYPADSGLKFRLRVATTSSNLSLTGCSYASTTQVITLNVITCIGLLNISLDYFYAGGQNDYPVLRWKTDNEYDYNHFAITRSTDGLHFNILSYVPGQYRNGASNYYAYADRSLPFPGKVYYRIQTNGRSGSTQSNIIVFDRNMKNTPNLVIYNNPFSETVRMGYHADASCNITATLTDSYGRRVEQQQYLCSTGANVHSLAGLGGLQKGVYTLRVTDGDKTIFRKLLKE
jgi:hypothetical protein